MKLTAVIEDKTIVKNNEGLFVDDADFWSTYSGINAFQIDTEAGTSDVELNDGTHRVATQSEIDALSAKYDAVDSDLTDQENAFLNSWENIRGARDYWLEKTDWSVLPDSPLSETEKNNYITYRQSLRDIPTTYSSEQPRDIEFDGNGNVSLNNITVISHP